MGTSLLPQLDLFADPVRARLLLLLEPRELSVGDLGEVLQLPQPTMSRHLKALADQGWVTSRADGTSRLYRANTRAQAEALGDLWRLVRAEVEGTAEVRRDQERVRHVLAQRQAREGFFEGAAGEWDELRTELFAPRFELLGLLGLMEPILGRGRPRVRHRPLRAGGIAVREDGHRGGRIERDAGRGAHPPRRTHQRRAAPGRPRLAADRRRRRSTWRC